MSGSEHGSGGMSFVDSNTCARHACQRVTRRMSRTDKQSPLPDPQFHACGPHDKCGAVCRRGALCGDTGCSTPPRRRHGQTWQARMHCVQPWTRGSPCADAVTQKLPALARAAPSRVSKLECVPCRARLNPDSVLRQHCAWMRCGGRFNRGSCMKTAEFCLIHAHILNFSRQPCRRRFVLGHRASTFRGARAPCGIDGQRKRWARGDDHAAKRRLPPWAQRYEGAALK